LSNDSSLADEALPPACISETLTTIKKSEVKTGEDNLLGCGRNQILRLLLYDQHPSREIRAASSMTW
jgi:hypothetical protein